VAGFFLFRWYPLAGARDLQAPGVESGLRSFAIAVKGGDIMKYVMLICEDPVLWTSLTDEERARHSANIFAYVDKWEKLGKWAGDGAELELPDSARTIRAGGDGPVITDGPYTDLKEVIGGLMLIQAGDLDEAVAIASGWPGIDYGACVEVRPIVQRG
jgi:hypothetical protein